MVSTQDQVPIQELRDDMAILKDGNFAVVLQTSAVNFGLLSEQEQLAIIASFAGMLNSLSFAIQIVVRSKRLDISQYLKLLDVASHRQVNPLLSEMIKRYKIFIERTIRENEVLDKQFFVVIPLSYLEVGLSKNVSTNFDKVKASLMPRRDHIIRQLARIGLKAKQLNTKELATLFFDYYNEEGGQILDQPSVVSPPAGRTGSQPSAGSQSPVASHQTSDRTNPPAPPPQPRPSTATLSGYGAPPPPAANTFTPNAQTAAQPQTANQSTPFVVEELPDDYGAVS